MVIGYVRVGVRAVFNTLDSSPVARNGTNMGSPDAITSPKSWPNLPKHGCYFQPLMGKYFLQNWGIYKMCDIQISDKISKTPFTEMRFSQDSHKLAI